MFQLVAGLIAFILGFWGWSLKQPSAELGGIFNNAFLTMQLVMLQFPLTAPGDIPWQLQIARIMLPLLAVSASFHLLVVSVTRPLSLAWFPVVKDHVIVHGDSEMTEGSLLNLARQERRIVVVSPRIEASRQDKLESMGLTIVDADPKQLSTLEALNIKHAAAIFITGKNDLENLNLAALVIQCAAKRPSSLPELILAVVVEREDLARDLDVALDGLTRSRNIRYHRMSPAREGLRLEFARYAPIFTRAKIDEPAHVLIVGLSGKWEQVLFQIITSIQDHPYKCPVLSIVVNSNEARKLTHWCNSQPDLPLLVELEILTAGEGLLPADEQVEKWAARRGAPHLVIALMEDADSVAAVLALRRPGNALGAQYAPALLRQDNEDRLFSALSGLKFDTKNLKGIRAFGGLIRSESMERILDRKGDDLAIALHACYLNSSHELQPNSSNAFPSWNNLPDNLREANRASASHVPILFASLGLEIWDKKPDVLVSELSDAEFERLARIEHRRWMSDRLEHGWRSGNERDDDRLIHPSIRSFDALSDSEKEKGINTVRSLVEVLEKTGKVLTKVHRADQ